MNCDEYQRLYSGGYNRKGQSVTIPEDVVRHSEHEPCFRCGAARDMCKHRRAA